MEIPYHQLGPAGRILVDNPPRQTAEQRRSMLYSVEGSGRDEEPHKQLQLVHGIERGLYTYLECCLQR